MNNIDQFIVDHASFNHASYLRKKWEKADTIGQYVSSYLGGMVEQAIYTMYKILVISAFVIMDLGLVMLYFVSKCFCDESVIQDQKKRLERGLVIGGDLLLGLFGNVIGIACPPASYRYHNFLEEKITKPYMKVWGLQGEYDKSIPKDLREPKEVELNLLHDPRFD